ncbi:hypothetical protein KEM52_001452 [Ascosphaera acerosa]|nr:hypothetical protein KEM52_001452 [Ascosphaera acerosa]
MLSSGACHPSARRSAPPAKRLLHYTAPIRIYHNGPRRFGTYQQRITQYPATPALLLPPTDLLCQTVSQAVKVAQGILSSSPGIAALASLARALYVLSPEDVRVINPAKDSIPPSPATTRPESQQEARARDDCQRCQKLARESITTCAAKKGFRAARRKAPLRQVQVQEAQQVPLEPGLGVQHCCDNDSELQRWCEECVDTESGLPESWDQQAAKQYVALICAEWPDVLIDETLQWPTNFANVERRPWGRADHEDTGFAPHRFLRIHAMHGCGPEDACRYMFQLVVTMVHEVGGHLFVTYLTRGRAHTPRAMRHPNYFPTIYEGAPESGRFLELALFGGALVFAGDGSTRFQQSGIPYLVAPDGLARRVNPQAMCKTITGAINFPLPTDESEVEYYRLPLLCGVDPDLEEDIVHQESERLSSRSREQVEVVSPYSV